MESFETNKLTGFNNPIKEEMKEFELSEQSFIDVLPKKEGSINFSQLRMIGHGGTHDVFICPQNPTFVIKLNRAVLEKLHSFEQAELSSEVRKIADEYVEGENSKREQLYKNFGQEHCLLEKVIIQKISINKDGVSQNLEGVISIQEVSDIFKDQNRKDFSTGYIEQNSSVEENKEVYNKMNKSLLCNDEFNENDFLKFSEKIRPIFELADQDKEFTNTVREFLSKFKNYFEESGRFIDLVGQENVLFYHKNGKWSFQLGSVIKNETKETMKKILGVLEENPEILNQNEEMRNQLMNQLTFIRLLNATGLKVGIGKIIDIKLTERQLENLDKVKFNSQ
jgi:hypothetical protein